MVKGVNVREYVKRDCVLFNSYCKGENVVLSNHYDKCVIDYQGVIFHSSEQLFFWILLEGDDVGREKVMECKTAKECLKKGRYYLNKRGWDKDSEEVQKAELQALRDQKVYPPIGFCGFFFHYFNYFSKLLFWAIQFI